MDQAIRDFQFQDFSQAESKFKQIIASDPGNISAHYYLGILYQEQKKYALAIHHLEIVAKSPGQVEGIEESLANAYMLGGKPEKALPYFRKQYQSHPDSEKATFDYARNLEAMGELDEAAILYRQLIRKKGKLADSAKYQLGQMLSGLGAYKSAFELMRAINPNSPYGGVAKGYQDALEPVVRPLSLYLSAEYFYNDNPGASSSRLTPGSTTTAGGGSQGVTLISSINTRALEATDHIRFKLGYLYYATFHQQQFAKENDFVGHFVNPAVIYRFNKTTELELKGDAQFFYYAHQKLSYNYGGTATVSYRRADGNALNFHAAYLNKKYTDSFASQGVLTSLAYLDADAWSVGAGFTASASRWNWGGSLLIDYTLNNENTNNTNHADPVLANKSRDSKFREHAVRLNTTLPLPSALSRIAFLGNMNYSYKDYLNSQTGALYANNAGQRVKSILLTLGVQMQIHLWKKYGIDLGIGYEQNSSRSHVDVLTYKSKRYFGQLTGNY